MSLPKHNEVNINQVQSFSTPMSWGISNHPRFMELMNEITTLVTPGFFLGDNLFTWIRNNSMFDDIAFCEAWQANILNDADKAIVWRRYILATAAYNCVQLEGDFVECGVYAGTGIKTVMDYLGGTQFPKTFWGYDTFDYNPVEGHHFEGQEEGFFEQIQTRFKDYRQVRLIKGLLPNSFTSGMPEKISFLHIDLNNAEAEVATLEALFDRVVTAGVVILDDYEWSSYRLQKIAEDKWFDARNYHVIPLPTGQGMIIKR